MLPKVISSSIEVIRVLHVDDDPNQYEFIKFFLNQIDPVLKVHCVSTPDEVFEELEKNSYDCLVTDFQMPEMNGIELSKIVRENDNIPIILYTGQGSEEVAESAFTIGIDDYIRKEMDPSHYQVLAKRIRHVVEKKQAETLYENVVEQARDAMCILIEGKIVFANHSAIELFKHESLEDLIGTNPLLKNSDILKPGFHRLEIEEKNSEKQYLEISSSPMTYSGKDAILCFLWDMTEKRVLEREKKISQERFRALVEISKDGIATFDLPGYVTFINDAFSELTGYSKEELVGKHITNMQTLRKRDVLKYVKGLAAIFQGNQVEDMDFTYIKKDGTPRIGYGYMSYVDLNGKKELILIAKDVTEERKKIIKYNLIAENSSSGIIEVDKNGKIITVNKKILRLLDQNKEELIENNILDLESLDEETRKSLEKIIANCRKDKKPGSYSFEGFLRSNPPINTIIKATPVVFDREFYGVQLELDAHTDYNTITSKTDQIKDNIITNQELDTLRNYNYDNEISYLLQTIQESVKILKNQKIYDEQLMNVIEEQSSIGIEKIQQLKAHSKKLPEVDIIQFSEMIEVDKNTQ